jgi:signal transduction histidine kinase
LSSARRGDDDLVDLPVDVRAVLELAGAEELETGMSRVIAILRQVCGAGRIEWWAPDDQGELRLIVADGEGKGRAHTFALEPAGAIVAFGGRKDARLPSTIARLTPILRRRWAEERVVDAAMKLARRNEALEDFAALVAHELKSPLQEALVSDDASRLLGETLDLVDSLLESARESLEETSSCADACLGEAVRDLGDADIAVTAKLTAILPLPAASLRVILRNLLRNAIAAGARHVHISAVKTSDTWRLLIDDDGVGLGDVGCYAAGSGLGLSLCRRIARRHDGALELEARPTGGTRATLLLGRTSLL